MKNKFNAPNPVLPEGNFIGFNRLFVHERKFAGKPYFLSPLKFRKRKNIGFSGRKVTKKMYSFSYPGRLFKFKDFLMGHANEIKLFADVGPASLKGAPTTFDASKLLPNSTVFAVDIHRPSFGGLDPAVRPLLHAISRKPLPNAGTWDAIRFANVAQHMSQSDRRRAIVNIWHSLKDGGYLLGAFTSHCFVLKKVTAPRRGWIEIPLE